MVDNWISANSLSSTVYRLPVIALPPLITDTSDADGGRVPRFKSATLDFVFLTGKTFARGDAVDGLDANESASFTVSGAAFAGFTESDICNGVFVRFEGYGKATGVSAS